MQTLAGSVRKDPHLKGFLPGRTNRAPESGPTAIRPAAGGVITPLLQATAPAGADDHKAPAFCSIGEAMLRIRLFQEKMRA